MPAKRREFSVLTASCKPTRMQFALTSPGSIEGVSTSSERAGDSIAPRTGHPPNSVGRT